MKDLDIIKQIGKELNVRVERLDELSWNNTGYIINYNGAIGLYLQDCNIIDLKRIISLLKDLKKLTELNLYDNKLIDISPLKDLKNLRSLSIGHNQLSDISPLKDLKNLTQLFIGSISYYTGKSGAWSRYSGNVTDISILNNLINLERLDLSCNQINDISSLKNLKNLKMLCLINNPIAQLPPWITDFKMQIKWGDHIYDNAINFNNPLKSPPPEIVKKGKTAVIKYFKSLEGEKNALNELKVLLVGDGGAGKTSLVKRVLGEKFSKNESQTHGINIRDWKVNQSGKDIIVHFWDFGGQEIMHATHQFFLSKRSLYILVLDGRKEEDAEYWLKHIESFGGNSPVLVVLNKMDENPGFDVNRKFLFDKYKGIKGFYRVSCAKGTGVKEFSAGMIGALTNVEILETMWARSWFTVKTQLAYLHESSSIIFEHLRSLLAIMKTFFKHRADQHRLLHQSVEQLTTRTRCSTVEPESIFVKIILKMKRFYTTLISSQQPAFDQCGNTVDLRQQILPQRGIFADNFVSIAKFGQSSIPYPSIRLYNTARFNTLLNSSFQTGAGRIRYQLKSNPRDFSSFKPYHDHSQSFTFSSSSTFSRLLTTYINFVNLDCTGKTISTWAYHSASKLMQQCPSSLITAKIKHSLQSFCVRPVFLTGQMPDSPKPKTQWHLSILKNSSSDNGGLKIAMTTLKQTSLCQPCFPMFTPRTAKAFRPPKIDQIFKTCFFCDKAFCKFKQSFRIILHRVILCTRLLLESSRYAKNAIGENER
jgi:small GTP-binding protein